MQTPKNEPCLPQTLLFFLLFLVIILRLVPEVILLELFKEKFRQQFLGIVVATLCRLVQPVLCHFVILVYTGSVHVAVAQHILRSVMSTLGSLFEPVHSVLVILAVVAYIIAHTDHILCVFIILFCRLVKPLQGGFFVLFLVEIVCTDGTLSIRKSQRRRSFKPVQGCVDILIDTLTVLVASAKGKLRIGVVLLCRFFQPIYRLFGIRLDAAAEPVARTQLKLCLCISGICRLPEQPQRILRITLDAVTVQVTDAQLAFLRDVALFCGFLKPVDRLAVLCL